MVINKFTGARGKSGSNDANAEIIWAHLRHIFDKAEVNFQTAELGKVDLGGGGTIALYSGTVWHECHRQWCGSAEHACTVGSYQQGRCIVRHIADIKHLWKERACNGRDDRTEKNPILL